MAAVTGTEDLRMVDSHRGFKECRRMTIFTGVGRQDVSWAFASRIETIVAGEAIAGDVRMIEDGGTPGC